MRRLLPVLLLLSLFLPASQHRFSGQIFGDFFYIPSSHRDDLDGMNGWWIRRIYLTYDYSAQTNLKVRVRLEASSPGDFSTKGVIRPFFKDAYINYRHRGLSLYVGLVPTPTWEFVEKFWGYRSIEKTPLDLHRLGSSRELGLGLRGNVGEKLGYWIVFGNGEGKKSEVNKGKKLIASLQLRPEARLFFQLYADYTGLDGGRAWAAQLFAGYSTESFTAGGLFAFKKWDLVESWKIRLFSLFAHFKAAPGCQLLFRVDHLLDPNPYGPSTSYIPFDSTQPYTLLIAGSEFKIAQGFSFIPNLEWVLYRGDSYVPNDLFLKLTFFYRW